MKLKSIIITFESKKMNGETELYYDTLNNKYGFNYGDEQDLVHMKLLTSRIAREEFPEIDFDIEEVFIDYDIEYEN